MSGNTAAAETPYVINSYGVSDELLSEGTALVRESGLRHVAFIMDGNGRWATARGLARESGHKEGMVSFEQVAEYCQGKGYHIDPEAFVAFYASKGWMVGKSPMKDWKSAVVTWTKSERQRIGSANTRSGYTSGVDRLAEMYREEFGNG